MGCEDGSVLQVQPGRAADGATLFYQSESAVSVMDLASTAALVLAALADGTVLGDGPL